MPTFPETKKRPGRTQGVDRIIFLHFQGKVKSHDAVALRPCSAIRKSMSISPRFMNDLRDRLTLSEIIGRRVKLTRAGREFKACCPFHHEKSPSFYVNDDKQFYHCFGCGAHGDAVEFVMQHDNQSFIEAVETLAAMAGMAVPEQSPQDIEQAQKQKSLYTLLDDTARFFEEQLRNPKHGDALKYLRDRALKEETMTAFRLGYAPPDGQALCRYLKDKGYTEDQMIESGVARRSSRDNQLFSFFRDRVMFPVADRRGRIVAFGGRVLPEHLRPLAPGESKPPKYINTGETSLFHKGRMLYGESHARQAAADGLPVIVVEGYLDVIGCHQAGFRGAVAPLGTALTDEQIVILWKIIPAEHKTPILCFDGDNAGLRAAGRAAENLLPLLKPDHSALIAFMPEGNDPDDLIRAHGARAFQNILDAAQPLADFLWDHHTAGRRFETPEERAGLSKTLDDETARIADRTVQQYYRQAFRERLFQSFGRRFAPEKKSTQRAAGRGGKKQGGPLPVSVPVRRPAYDGEALSVQILLATLINHPALFGKVEEAIGHITASGRLDALLQAVVSALSAEPALDTATLQHHLKEQGFGHELAAILSPAVYTHAGFARPEAEEATALAGWREALGFVQKRQVWRELQAAGRVLAGDFTPENEQKVIALQDIQKSGQS